MLIIALLHELIVFLYRIEKPQGGGSSILNVPGDVPPQGYSFWTSSLAKGILFGNFSGV